MAIDAKTPLKNKFKTSLTPKFKPLAFLGQAQERIFFEGCLNATEIWERILGKD